MRNKVTRFDKRWRKENRERELKRQENEGREKEILIKLK